MKKTKVKKQFPEDFRTSFAFSTMTWPVAASTVFLTSFFMLYLTDYSGIDAAVGKAGFAAAFGTILLLIARIIDIFDDPFQAWLVDNSKDGRLGKYRKYAFANILLVSIAIICIFSIPQFVKSNTVLLCAWVGVFYLLYEVGVAFSVSMPLLQKTTYDTKLRTKLTSLMRIWMIVILVPVYFYITIVTFVDQSVGNMSKSFSMVCIVMMAVFAIVSFIGVSVLKERPEAKAKEGESSKKLSVKEVLQMFKQNKPLLVHAGAMLLSNIVFGLVSAIAVYFLKWYYSADLASGTVDAVKYGEIYGLFAISGLLPNFIAPVIAGKVVKKAKTYSRATTLCLLVAIVIYAASAVLFFTGILRISPFLFIAINFLTGIATGVAVIPQTLLWAEGADYAEYKTGKNMSAMVNSVNNIIGKAQAALSTILTGGILIAVGYSVNKDTGNYAGDISQLPKMITGFGIFMTIVPIVVMMAACLMYKFMYPITPELQKEIVATLAERRSDAE